MSGRQSTTGADFVRAVGNAAAFPAVDAAIKRRAEQVAAELARDGTTTRILKRGPGDYVVAASGQGVFAREFGSVDTPAAPFVGTAIARAGKP